MLPVRIIHFESTIIIIIIIIILCGLDDNAICIYIFIFT